MEAPSAPPAAAAEAGPAAPDGCLLVMRHGARLDEAEPGWAAAAARPWDTPLSAHGAAGAAAAAPAVAAALLPGAVALICSSPFLRCLQTAAACQACLPGGCAVDLSLAEVCSSRLLPGLPAATLGAPIGDWLWGAAGGGWHLESGRLPPAVAAAVGTPSGLPAPALAGRAASAGPAPAHGESVTAAHARYAAALMALAARHAGSSVLVVTHGEAVRAAVRLADTRADAYAVEPLGFVALPTRRGVVLATSAAELRCHGVAVLAAPPEDEGAEGQRGGSSGRPPPEPPEPEPSAPPL